MRLTRTDTILARPRSILSDTGRVTVGPRCAAAPGGVPEKWAFSVVYTVSSKSCSGHYGILV